MRGKGVAMMRTTIVALVVLSVGCGAVGYKTLDEKEADARAARERADVDARAAEAKRREQEGARRAAADDEARRQMACALELERVRAAEREVAKGEERRAELAKCPNSGLPVGSYTTRDDAPGPAFVDVEVSDQGCAAFLASDGSCTVRGVIDAAGQNHARGRITKGDACSRFDLAVEVVTFKIQKGASPAVEVNGRKGGKPIVVKRASESVVLDGAGLPRLWASATSRDDDGGRVSVALAEPPSSGAPAERDSCRALDNAKVRTERRDRK
jgi:hypothetical protein